MHIFIPIPTGLHSQIVVITKSIVQFMLFSNKVMHILIKVSVALPRTIHTIYLIFLNKLIEANFSIMRTISCFYSLSHVTPGCVLYYYESEYEPRDDRGLRQQ